jgi:hypothetical protein
MSRFVPSVLVVLIAGFNQAQRDQQPPPQPQVRQIPVGNASISGSVTAADTGRPVRGASVQISGTMAAATNGTLSTLRSGGSVATLPGAAQTPSRGAGAGPLRMPPMSTYRTAMTDAQGSFSVEHLPAGQYSISVQRGSFLGTSYGQKKPGGPGTPVSLADGQKLSLTFELVRGGVISGRVTSDDGEPLLGTQIRGWRFTNNNGVKRLQSVGYASTDDRGEYRMSGLQPGDYIVSATPNVSDAVMFDRMLSDTKLIEEAIAAGGVQPPAAPGFPATVSITMPVPSAPQGPQQGMGPPGFLPIFHPSVAAPLDATVIRVTGGDDHPNIDIQARSIQATNIEGTVTNPPGNETAVQLTLVNDDPMMQESGGGARADQNGRFTFRNIGPGRYTIVATVVPSPTMTIVNGVSQRPPGPPAALDDSQKLWGRTPIEVNGEPFLSATVNMRPGRTVSGQVIFDMERPPDLTRLKMRVSLNPAPGASQPMYGQMPQAELGPDGRFTLTAIPPGRYMFQLPGVPKSAIVNGEDTLDGGFNFTAARDVTDAVLTITDKVTEITGVLMEATGRPVTNFSVIAATIDERYWTPASRRIMVSRQSPDGRYTLRNLPPGTYMLAALADLDPGGQYDLDLLKSLASSGAMRVTLGEGQKLTQDLQVKR